MGAFLLDCWLSNFVLMEIIYKRTSSQRFASILARLLTLLSSCCWILYENSFITKDSRAYWLFILLYFIIFLHPLRLTTRTLCQYTCARLYASAPLPGLFWVSAISGGVPCVSVKSSRHWARSTSNCISSLILAEKKTQDGLGDDHCLRYDSYRHIDWHGVCWTVDEAFPDVTRPQSTSSMLVPKAYNKKYRSTLPASLSLHTLHTIISRTFTKAHLASLPP